MQVFLKYFLHSFFPTIGKHRQLIGSNINLFRWLVFLRHGTKNTAYSHEKRKRKPEDYLSVTFHISHKIHYYFAGSPCLRSILFASPNSTKRMGMVAGNKPDF